MHNTYFIRIGTIHDLTGTGEEWLVDARTRQYVIAKFFNGNLMADNYSPTLQGDEPTVPNAVGSDPGHNGTPAPAALSL